VGGINLKALLLSSILTILMEVISQLFLVWVLRDLLILFLICLPFLHFFFAFVLLPAITAFLYYKFNNSSISVTEGSIAGACYFIGVVVISMILLVFIPALLGLNKKTPILSSLTYDLPIALICVGGKLILSVASGAVVGALFGRIKEEMAKKAWEDTW